MTCLQDKDSSSSSTSNSSSSRATTKAQPKHPDMSRSLKTAAPAQALVARAMRHHDLALDPPRAAQASLSELTCPGLCQKAAIALAATACAMSPWLHSGDGQHSAGVDRPQG